MRLLGLLLVALVLLAWLASRPTHAEGAQRQSLDAVRARVTDFLESEQRPGAEEVRIHVSRLDPRLRLPACSTDLAPFLPPGRTTGSNVTVGVRCAGSRPWTVYVPARIETFVSVAVLDAPLRRGDVVGAADVRLETREVGALHDGYFTRIDQVLGMVARRSLNQGTTIRASMLTRPTLIRRGESVTLVARNSAVQVRTEGKALEDGTRGEVIGVRNVRSNRIVEGVVVSPGVVEVRL